MELEKEAELPNMSMILKKKKKLLKSSTKESLEDLPLRWKWPCKY